MSTNDHHGLYMPSTWRFSKPSMWRPIGKSVADLVALYCNSEKCTWDPSLYSLRNKLIHGSGRPELGRPLFQLQQVVRLTLIGIIQAAAIQAR